MTSSRESILTINSGSSSLKFALYEMGGAEMLRVSGKLTRIGTSDGQFTVSTDRGPSIEPANLPDHVAAGQWLFDWLQRQPNPRIDAVGHRLVHGGRNYRSSQRVTPDLLSDLRPLIPFAPDHLPAEISLIETVSRLYPDLPQVVCFDTAFHLNMPERAKRLPIPRHLADEGLVRYGFHGLSYEYVLSELAREAGTDVAQGRVVLAHLGNGASMAAVWQGKSIDTTMGFTPAGGLMMGTRSGDLDPGVLLYLLANNYKDPVALSRLLNEESGLRGVSGLSSDMQELLKQAPYSPPAAEAIDLFCYLAQKQVGALMAVLNGLDTLVFTGGIGENAPAIRAKLCAQLEFVGIALDPDRNAADAAIISPEGRTPVVRVIPTNEERIIARHTRQVLHTQHQQQTYPLKP